MYKDMGTWTGGAWGRGEVRGPAFQEERLPSPAHPAQKSIVSTLKDLIVMMIPPPRLADRTGRILPPTRRLIQSSRQSAECWRAASCLMPTALSRKPNRWKASRMFRFEELPVYQEKSEPLSAVLEPLPRLPGAREQVEAQQDALKPGSVRPACARPASRMSRNRWPCSRRKTACRRMCWIW